MILQALCGYYHRLAADPANNAAPPGYAYVLVSAVLTLDADGGIVSAYALSDGKNKLRLLAPLPPKRSGPRPKPAFLCESPEFLFGIYAKPDGATYRFNASREIHETVLKDADDAGARAVLRFFERRTIGTYQTPDVDTSALDSGGAVVFRLEGDTDYMHNRPAVRAAWAHYNAAQSADVPVAQCLVTGNVAPVAQLHGNLSGFGMDKPTLVSFKQESFQSYRKIQGDNAPVSEQAAFEYVTALSALLLDRKHCATLGGDKVVFWAEREAEAEEALTGYFFNTNNDVADGNPPEAGDDAETGKKPARKRKPRPEDAGELDAYETQKMESMLTSLKHGKSPADIGLDPDVRFYLLGIAANKTRAVIRFFYTDTFGHLVDAMVQHLRDIEIVEPAWEATQRKTPRRILRETAVAGKYDNIPRTLEAALMRSILWRTQYPHTLYMAMLGRIRAEIAANPHAANATRVGLIKGFLNRADRNMRKEERMTVALNPEQKNPAYLLGRLFAVMAHTQQAALGDVNSSIVDKYFNTALAAPQTVFPMLTLLFQKHLSKLSKTEGMERAAVYYSRIAQSILGELPDTGFPVSLNAEGQGIFVIGFYHQRQDLFTKKSKDAPAEAAEDEPAVVNG